MCTELAWAWTLFTQLRGVTKPSSPHRKAAFLWGYVCGGREPKGTAAPKGQVPGWALSHGDLLQGQTVLAAYPARRQ